MFSDVEVPVVTEAKRKPALNFSDYVKLTWRYLLSKGKRSIDTHGGYFSGQLSQTLIHELTLLGFQRYLERSHGNSIDAFHQKLQQQQIQTVISKDFIQKFSLKRPVRK